MLECKSTLLSLSGYGCVSDRFHPAFVGFYGGMDLRLGGLSHPLCVRVSCPGGFECILDGELSSGSL